jgi:hypothetical protein
MTFCSESISALSADATPVYAAPEAAVVPRYICACVVLSTLGIWFNTVEGKTSSSCIRSVLSLKTFPELSDRCGYLGAVAFVLAYFPIVRA